MQVQHRASHPVALRVVAENISEELEDYDQADSTSADPHHKKGENQ